MSIREANEMITRVANAIGDAMQAGQQPMTPEFRREMQPRFEMFARAAFAAMRDPTPEMLTSIVDTYVGALPGTTLAYVWKAMIDAALE